jgi:hypothetical protein
MTSETATPEEARAFRPRLDDPTRLENGWIHPDYEKWIRHHGHNRDFIEYVFDHAPLTEKDGKEYFDRHRPTPAHGATGNDRGCNI